MLQYYQELLNECIDIQERENTQKILKSIFAFMKGEK